MVALLSWVQVWLKQGADESCDEGPRAIGAVKPLYYVEAKHPFFSVSGAAAAGIEEHEQHKKKMRCRTCGRRGCDAMDAGCSTVRVPRVHVFVSPDPILLEGPQTSGIGPVLPPSSSLSVWTNIADEGTETNNTDATRSCVCVKATALVAGRTKQKVTQFWRQTHGRQLVLC